MNFSILTPLPGYPNFRGAGGVWVVGGLVAYCGRCVQTLVLNNFFLYVDSLTHGGGPGSKLQVPRVGPPYGPLPGRTEPFSPWRGCLVAPQAVFRPLQLENGHFRTIFF